MLHRLRITTLFLASFFYSDCGSQDYSDNIILFIFIVFFNCTTPIQDLAVAFEWEERRIRAS